jgi:enoyl-CoA hydratase/carnithine racemase
MGTIDLSLDAGVLTATINRPDRSNAWTRAMREPLRAALRDAADDDAVRAVVITGAGQAFCAGQDLHEVAEWDEHTPWIDEIWGLYLALLELPKPTIAAINGVAAGSGLQFALLCDYRVAAPEARLGQTEARWGLASITGTWLLRETVGPITARAMALSARLVEGDLAHAWGIVDELAPTNVLETARMRALEMAGFESGPYALTKGWIQQDQIARLSAAFDAARSLHSEAFRTGASNRGVQGFIERG